MIEEENNSSNPGQPDKPPQPVSKVPAVEKTLALFIPIIAGVVIACVIIYQEIKGCCISISEQAISLISLAIAVWTGINIMNVIDRSEFDTLRKNVEDYEQKSNELIQPLNENIKTIKDLQWFDSIYTETITEEFYNILETSEDAFYRHLGALYRTQDESLSSNKTDVDSKNQSNILFLRNRAMMLARIKDILYIRSLHEKNTLDCARNINSAADLIEKAVSTMTQNPDSTLTELDVNVLKFITADLYFYKAFAIRTIQDSNDSYLQSAKLFSSANDIYIGLKDFFINKLTNNIIFRYYYNSIAQCYSEILLCYDKITDEQKLSSLNQIISCNTAISETEKYSAYITEGSSVGQYPFADERYYKNRGLLYDRIARLCTDNVDNKYASNMDKAISFYNKARTVPRTEKMEKTYQVLCSALNNYVKFYIHGKPNINSKEDFIRPNSTTSLWQNGLIQDSAFYNTISSMAISLRNNSFAAMHYWPGKTMFCCFYILSKIYLGIPCDDSERKKLIPEIEGDIQVFLSETDTDSSFEKATRTAFRNIKQQYS